MDFYVALSGYGSISMMNVCVLWQAVIVSEHKTLEADRLRAAMDALLQEAGQRILREVGKTEE